MFQQIDYDLKSNIYFICNLYFVTQNDLISIIWVETKQFSCVIVPHDKDHFLITYILQLRLKLSVLMKVTRMRM
jgi:hypothetical protein